MKLTEIRINKFKSIKEQMVIKIDNSNNLITLIGKNGSGKTNILQAIRESLTTYHYRSEKELIDSEYKFIFTAEEINRYSDFVDVDDKTNEVIVKCSNISNKTAELTKRIYSSALKGISEEYSIKLKKEYEIYKKTSKEYLNKLEEILDQYSFFDGLKLYENKIGNYLQILTKNELEMLQRNYKSEITKLENLVEVYGDKKGLTFDNVIYRLDHFFVWELYQLPIEEEENKKISPIILKTLGIKKNQIEAANKKYELEIKKINNQLREKYERLIESDNNMRILIEKINKIFSYEYDKVIDEEGKVLAKHDTLISVLSTHLNKKCYFIDNEDSLLFYNNQRNYYNDNRRKYLNNENPIIKAIDNFLNANHYYLNDESLLSENTISESRLEIIENIVNKKFLDKQLNGKNKFVDLRYSVKLKKNNNSVVIDFYVKEKTGDEVNLNDTSLGRRWLLTYQFIEKLLVPGDVLLIDEPAAFLHPGLQLDFQKQLKALAATGVYVFITTHSPYMIDDEWCNVYNVTYSSKGTKINSYSLKDEILSSIKRELGIKQTSEILFNLSKTILLVEGKNDKICIEKFAKLLKYKIDDYFIMPCNGSAIIGFCYLCIKQDIKFKALLDYDTHNKPDAWLKRQYGYKEYLDIINNNEDCVFTQPKNNYESIEAYFSITDVKNCFTEIEKPDKSKILKLNGEKLEKTNKFSKETLDNFEQLFTKLGIPKLTK